MTFSSRYKNKSDPKKASNPPSEHHRLRNRDLPLHKGFEKDKDEVHVTRFKRSTAQASRLIVTNAPAKSKINIPWRFYLSVIIFALVMIGLVATWMHRNQWLFPIKHVALQGHFERVQPLAIQAELGHYAKGSLLLLPAKELKAQLEALPWVSQVRIKRQWPNTLLVDIEQRNTVARFGNSQLLDDRGQVFIPPEMKGVDNLPVIIGPENRAAQLWQGYLALNDILKPIQLTITKLEVTPRLAYTLTLSNGIVLYLGSSDVVNRLTIFAKVYSKTLASRATLVQYADMRYDSGMAVGWRQPQTDAKSKSLKSQKKPN